MGCFGYFNHVKRNHCLFSSDMIILCRFIIFTFYFSDQQMLPVFIIDKTTVVPEWHLFWQHLAGIYLVGPNCMENNIFSCSFNIIAPVYSKTIKGHTWAGRLNSASWPFFYNTFWDKQLPFMKELWQMGHFHLI